MIQMAVALPAGNAVQLHLAPPPGATSWRVLRRGTDAPIETADAPGVFVVAQQTSDACVTDILSLENGRPYWYRVFYQDRRGNWLYASDHVTATPLSSYRGDELDVHELVRSRLELGMTNEVVRKRVKPGKTGRIEVTAAPFGLSDNLAFPIISVHLETDGSGERGIGEILAPDTQAADGTWTETTGWMARVVLKIVGVSENPTTRTLLHNSIKRVVQANLPIFEAKGLCLIDFAQTNMEDTEHYSVPLYFTIGTFSCHAPSFVADEVGDVEDVDATMLNP